LWPASQLVWPFMDNHAAKWLGAKILHNWRTERNGHKEHLHSFLMAPCVYHECNIYTEDHEYVLNNEEHL
jgi:hypothetical protein